MTEIIKQWFVVHTQTGVENRVKTMIENRVKFESREDHFGDILIPTESVAEIRDGKKRVVSRKFYPGYILIEMDLNDDTWYFIRTIPGVTGFIGAGKKPTPLSQEEIDAIVRRTAYEQEKPKPKVLFEIGEGVKIIDGPFLNFNGNVDDINNEKGVVKVLVPIFGRTTPVELEFWQVEKL